MSWAAHSSECRVLTVCRRAGDGSECRVLTVCRRAGDGSECRVLTVCVDRLVMVASVGYLLCVSTGW